jgi:hypothetical protein
MSRLEIEENIRDISPSQVRLPTDLKEKLKAAAQENKTSFSAEVVRRLYRSFDDQSLNLASVKEMDVKDLTSLMFEMNQMLKAYFENGSIEPTLHKEEQV